MPPALEAEEAADPFLLTGTTFTSRLLLGTGGVPSLEALERAVVAAGTELVTIGLRRVEASASAGCSRSSAAAGTAPAEHRRLHDRA